MMIDLRTPAERARDERNKQICDQYRKYIKEMPDIAPHRLFRFIAEDIGMTVPGVRKIIINAGRYRCGMVKTDS